MKKINIRKDPTSSILKSEFKPMTLKDSMLQAWNLLKSELIGWDLDDIFIASKY